MDNEYAIIASSPLRAIAHAGIGGIVAIVGLWMTFLIKGFKTSGGLGVLSVAAIVHSIFEGWLLSPVGPMLMVFVLGWWAVSRVTVQIDPEAPVFETPSLSQKVGPSTRGR